MPRKLPLHVVRQRTRHGRVVFYFRRAKGRRIRLPDLAAPEFAEAYRAALAGGAQAERKPADPRSLRWLVARYMESAEWAGLAGATRKQRGAVYRQIVASAGDKPFAAIDARAIRAGVERRAATPAQAIVFLKAMRKLFAWAGRNDLVAEDPGRAVERPTYRTEGFAAWDFADWRAYCARWPVGTQQRLRAELLLYTGLRRSDIVRLGRQHIGAGGVWSLRTAKTGTPVTGVLPPHVLATIAAEPLDRLHLVAGEGGGPLTAESFGNYFRDDCRAAGVAKSAHGLRKMATAVAADGGATTHELMGFGGWESLKQPEHYSRSAERARAGMAASRKLAERMASVLAPHPISGEGLATENSTKSRAEK